MMINALIRHEDDVILSLLLQLESNQKHPVYILFDRL